MKHIRAQGEQKSREAKAVEWPRRPLARRNSSKIRLFGRKRNSSNVFYACTFDRILMTDGLDHGQMSREMAPVFPTAEDGASVIESF